MHAEMVPFYISDEARRGRRGRRRRRLEVGHGREFVPLHRLLAEVKVLQPQRDSAQEEVLPERLGAEHAQLELPQAQSFSAVAAVDQLQRRRRRGGVSLLQRHLRAG